MRMPFDEVFTVQPDGLVLPKVTVRIGGVTMGTDVAFGDGVSIGNLNLVVRVGKDLEVEIEGGVYVIKRAY